MPSDNNIISVIVATYNRCHDLKDTIQSLLNCELSEEFEVEFIVVDNNSTDHTKEVVSQFQEQAGGRLRYFFEPQQGKSFALNTGIQQAQGEIIACTDDDCLVPRDYLKTVWRIFREKQLDILAGQVVPVFTKELPQWLDLQYFTGPYVYHYCGDEYLENDRERISLMGANAVLRKSAVKKFGGFKTAGRGQDVELFYSWVDQGAKYGYSPDLKVNHKTPSERLTKKYLRRWYFLAGRNFSEMFAQECTQGRTVFGISFWVYRRLIKNIFNYVKHLLRLDQKYVYNESRIFYGCGIICGRWGWKGKASENLRER